MLMKVTNRTNLQQFGRKKRFISYNPWWFCHSNFLNTLYFFFYCLKRLISPDPILFYVWFYFFYCPFLYFIFVHVGKKLYSTLTVHSQNSPLKICVYAVILTEISCVKQGICISVTENRICFDVFCFSHHHGILALGNFSRLKKSKPSLIRK